MSSDFYHDWYIRRYGIDAWERMMDRREKVMLAWEARWSSWEPTGIQCPCCGKELRLNREGGGPGTTDDWIGSPDDVWVPYDRTYRQASVWDTELRVFRHCEYVCLQGHCYDAERRSLAIEPDELRRIFAGQGSAHLMLDTFGVVPYWGVLRLSPDMSRLELVRPTHRAKITGSRYLKFLENKWGPGSLPRLTRAQFKRYLANSDVNAVYGGD